MHGLTNINSSEDIILLGIGALIGGIFIAVAIKAHFLDENRRRWIISIVGITLGIMLIVLGILLG